MTYTKWKLYEMPLRITPRINNLKYSDMDFFKAVKIAQANRHLIGKKLKDKTIDEIIIMPTNANSQNEFLKRYIQTLDAQQSIVPFMNDDVVVCVLCKELIRMPVAFIPTPIYNLPQDYGVVLDL